MGHHHPGLGQVAAREEKRIVTAQAPSVYAQAPIGDSAPAALIGTATAAPKVALPPDERLRAALIGLVLAALAIATTTVLAVLILAGPFHTSLGSIG
jgi:hypothetical protein